MSLPYTIPMEWTAVPAAVPRADVDMLVAVGAAELRGVEQARQWRLMATARHGSAGARTRTAAPQRYLFHCAGNGEDIHDTTYGGVVEVPAQTVAVQLAIRNYADMPAELQMAVAPSAAVGDRVSPINAAGVPDDTLFQQVTLHGSPLLALPRCVQTGGIVPVPSMTMSDPVYLPLDAPARSDGRPGRLLFIREYAVRGPTPVDQFDIGSHEKRMPAYGDDPNLITPSLGGGWQYRGNAARPDYGVLRPSPWFQYNRSVVIGNFVVPILAARAGTILITGDSVVSGYGSDDGAMTIASELARMVMAARPGLVVSVWNEAQQGDISADYLPRAANALPHVRPVLTLIQAYSRNDHGSDSRAQAYLQFQRTMALADQAAMSGSAVLLMTSSPFGSIGSQARYDEFRDFSDGLVRGCGLPVLDLARLWGVAGARPSAFRPDFSMDAAHPTNRAITLAAAAALPYAMTLFN